MKVFATFRVTYEASSLAGLAAFPASTNARRGSFRPPLSTGHKVPVITEIRPLRANGMENFSWGRSGDVGNTPETRSRTYLPLSEAPWRVEELRYVLMKIATKQLLLGTN